MRLNEKFRSKPIKFSRYTCSVNTQSDAEVQSMPVKVDSSINRCWNFTAGDVSNEMRRQKTDKIDIKFCLTWHTHCRQNNIELFDSKKDPLALDSPPYMDDQNGRSIITLVIFMLLDNLSYFTEDGGTTVFGSALNEARQDVQVCFRLLRYVNASMLTLCGREKSDLALPPFM